MAFDKTRFGGVVAPIVNPCGEDDSLDRGALEANLTRLLATHEQPLRPLLGNPLISVR